MRVKELFKSHLLHQSQRRTGHDRHQRRHRRKTHQRKLKESVVLANRCRVDLCRRQREVPVSHEGLRRWQRDPSEIDSRDGERNIATKDDNS